jgi:hypothetical protein
MRAREDVHDALQLSGLNGRWIIPRILLDLLHASPTPTPLRLSPVYEYQDKLYQHGNHLAPADAVLPRSSRRWQSAYAYMLASISSLIMPTHKIRFFVTRRVKRSLWAACHKHRFGAERESYERGCEVVRQAMLYTYDNNLLSGRARQSPCFVRAHNQSALSRSGISVSSACKGSRVRITYHSVLFADEHRASSKSENLGY